MSRSYTLRAICTICDKLTLVGPRTHNCEPCSKNIKRVKNLGYQHERMKNPEYAKKMKAYKRDYQQEKRKDPEYAKKKNAYSRAYREEKKKDPEYTKKLKNHKRAYQREQRVKRNLHALTALAIKLKQIGKDERK